MRPTSTGSPDPSIRRAASLACLVLAGSLAAATPARAQIDLGALTGSNDGTAAAEDEDRALTAAAVAERLRRAEDELKAIRAAATTDGARAAVDLLERIRAALESQADTIEREIRPGEDDELPAGELDGGAAGLVGHAAPYRVVDLDRVLSQRDAVLARRDALETEVEAQQLALETLGRQLEERERERRAIQSAVDGGDSDAGIAARLRQARLESRLARERERLARLQLRGAKSGIDRCAGQLGALSAILAEVRAALRPTDDDLKQPLLQLDDELGKTDSAVESARAAVERARTELGRLDDEPAPSSSDAAAVERLAARRQAVRLAEAHVELLQQRRERIERMREFWTLRIGALRSEFGPTALSRAIESIESDLTLLERRRRVSASRLDELRARLQELAVHGREVGGSTPAARWIAEQRDALDEAVARREQDLADGEQAVQLIQRALNDLREADRRVGLGDRLAAGWQRFIGIWRYEFNTIDDQPITVGKVVSALLLFIVGIFVSRFFSVVLSRRLLRKLGTDPGASAIFQTLSFYLLLLLFFLWALAVVNIPLTAFTVLGGALAIGVGFGSQNIVNNFISGLIMMAERPIKVGDLIDVDGVAGMVERIGPRSTRVRRGDNTHMIVPNSSFLEKNVLNWSLSDDRMRIEVDVGVVYGSPVDRVTELLFRAVEENDKIMEHPRPEVLFVDFGNDALLFRVMFWIRVRRVLDRQRIQSEVRYRVETLFRDAHIVIAFPQRDVHLDTARPLDVRLLRDGGAGETE